MPFTLYDVSVTPFVSLVYQQCSDAALHSAAALPRDDFRRAGLDVIFDGRSVPAQRAIPYQ